MVKTTVEFITALAVACLVIFVISVSVLFYNDEYRFPNKDYIYDASYLYYIDGSGFTETEEVVYIDEDGVKGLYTVEKVNSNGIYIKGKDGSKVFVGNDKDLSWAGPLERLAPPKLYNIRAKSSHYINNIEYENSNKRFIKEAEKYDKFIRSFREFRFAIFVIPSIIFVGALSSVIVFKD